MLCINRFTGTSSCHAYESPDDGQCTAGPLHSVSIPTTATGSLKSGQQLLLSLLLSPPSQVLNKNKLAKY